MADLHLGEGVDASHARTGTVTVIDTADLTTHGVIVGMTGSGKTGLAIDLIEECLAAGVPSLLIDPKGDLTNLCLLFPDLAPADFRPWINDGDAQKAGVSPDDFAGQQATAWKDGLASWGIGPDRMRALHDGTRFTIYTPGSTAGTPMNIVGSLQAPTDTSDLETMRDEVEGYVSGLLGLIGIDADPLSLREHILLSNLIETSWSAGQSLDLATLVGQVQTPPIRKLGVFELDTFFPPKDRTALALRLNGLLASPSFAAWAQGAPVDLDAMLHAPDGRPCAAIVTIAHLSDEERQFVVSLLLAKVVTWMRRQSGTTDLRALVYMDEVAGYLPPTANPPTKQPIMTLMKQARAFGVGMVLATQNPVDVDYKAISNAGTWLVGRLQTDRDKARLLDGMSAAAGGVEVKEVGDTISALGKREFLLRRAGKDRPDVFTSRWAMSYLRGPLTRDQIASLTAEAVATPAAAPATPAAPAAAMPPPPGAPLPPPTAVAPVPVAAASPAPITADDETPVMPKVAQGVTIRYVDPAAPWLAAVGAAPGRTRLRAGAAARVRLRYDDEKADFVKDEEWEAVLAPLTASADPTSAIAVDYDDRDLVTEAPSGARYVLSDVPVDQKAFWTQLQRDLVDHLVRAKPTEMLANRTLKLYSRTEESPEQFAVRCTDAADAKADEATAGLRDKYEAKAKRLQSQLDAAESRVDVAATQAKATHQNELVSTAGSLLGSFLGGKRNSRSMMGQISRSLGTSSSKRGQSATAGARLDAAQSKVAGLQSDLADLENDLATDIQRIHDDWMAKAAAVETVQVPLEKSDVSIAELVLLWLPVG